MEPLIVIAVPLVLIWLLLILPQQRRVRAHQALVDSVQPGDQVVLSAGIHGRVVDLGPDELQLEVAPGVVLRVARQAVLRRVEDAVPADDGTPPPAGAGPEAAAPDVPADPDDRGPAGRDTDS